MKALKPVEVVAEFYRAVAEQDAGALVELVNRHFDEHASVTWPESLPYGGTLTGRKRLAAALSGAASNPDGPGPSGVRVRNVISGQVDVAIELEFDWAEKPGAPKIPCSAVEWWAFTDSGTVLSMTAYYRDTAALLGHQR